MAQCVIQPGADLQAKQNQLEFFVEKCRDSSRYFVIRIVHPRTKRVASLGIGFRARETAFSFTSALQDHMRAVRRERAAASAAAAAESAGAGTDGTAAAASLTPTRDLTLGEGQKLSLSIKVAKDKKKKKKKKKKDKKKDRDAGSGASAGDDLLGAFGSLNVSGGVENAAEAQQQDFSLGGDGGGGGGSDDEFGDFV